MQYEASKIRWHLEDDLLRGSVLGCMVHDMYGYMECYGEASVGECVWLVYADCASLLC